MVGTLTADGTNPSTEPDAHIGIPALRLSPRSGSELESGSQDVIVGPHDFTTLVTPVEASGTFTIMSPDAEPPSVGDSTVPTALLAGLSVLAVLLLGSGGLLLRRRSKI